MDISSFKQKFNFENNEKKSEKNSAIIHWIAFLVACCFLGANQSLYNGRLWQM
jgi:hypothetical protein